MIHDNDRSGYIGASDTIYVMSDNRDTKTWRNWWDEKLGLITNSFQNKYTRAGSMYEHAILETLAPDIDLDFQVIHEDLKLRVNYDGIKGDVIIEVKTHKAGKPFIVSKAYWMQAQVEMYALGTDMLYIASYGLYPGEYDQLCDVDFDRIQLHKIEYNKKWVHDVYLPRLKELAEVLKRG